ncbi:MAG: Rid family detoxifying hydrolase [Cryobacterium sp.]|nr:Rid family detoxifying hydrolase [Cryobacterium sp.]
MTPNSVTSEHAPAPVGPYSHACATPSGLVYLSGQTPIDPATNELVTGGITEQTARVFRNLEHVLEAAGCGFRDVVKVNVYLVDMNDFAEMNAVYATYFDGRFPARTTVAVAGLPLGARVEIEMQALQP